MLGSLAACNTVAGLDGLEFATSSGSGAAGASTSATESSGSNVSVGSGAGGEGPCPGTAGPEPVRVSLGAVSFCIDSTEVTNGQYLAFVMTGPSVNDLPSICQDNVSFVPGTSWPPMASQLDLPVGGPTWCDAWAYCNWAGKRLCGRIGGGAVEPTDRTNAFVDEWMFACTGGGVHVEPYGDTYVDGTCVGGGWTGAKPAPVGTATMCEGGFPGLFDMVGNIAEWEDACEANTGPADNCDYRGGEHGHAPDVASLSCGVQETFPRDSLEPTGGFRCCGS
jgi:formylglycine-generating enzyme required for sulfatase activity